MDQSHNVYTIAAMDATVVAKILKASQVISILIVEVFASGISVFVPHLVANWQPSLVHVSILIVPHFVAAPAAVGRHPVEHAILFESKAAVILSIAAFSSAVGPEVAGTAGSTGVTATVPAAAAHSPVSVSLTSAV